MPREKTPTGAVPCEGWSGVDSKVVQPQEHFLLGIQEDQVWELCQVSVGRALAPPSGGWLLGGHGREVGSRGP